MDTEVKLTQGRNQRVVDIETFYERLVELKIRASKKPIYFLTLTLRTTKNLENIMNRVNS